MGKLYVCFGFIGLVFALPFASVEVFLSYELVRHFLENISIIYFQLGFCIIVFNFPISRSLNQVFGILTL